MKRKILDIGLLLSILISTFLFVSFHIQSIETKQSETSTQIIDKSKTADIANILVKDNTLISQVKSGVNLGIMEKPIILTEGISVKTNKIATIVIVTTSVIIFLFSLLFYSGRKRKSNV